MFKGIARLFVATAAGAGLGAGAAFARRHLLRGSAVAAPEAWTPAAPAPAASAPSAPAAPAPGLMAPSPNPEPQAPPLGPPPPPSATDAADLDVARNRLRRRAAELRAEMEG